MPAGSILVIDDDHKLCELLKKYLLRFDYEVVTVSAGCAGLKQIRKKRPDLVVLDVMLPVKDGFEILKEIRASTTIPVIMLTARGEVTDKVVGLELGADDYLAKPFEPRELVARIQTVLRRTQQAAQNGNIKKFKELTLDLDSHAVSVDGVEINLTTTEFEILSLFATNPGKVLTRDDLMERVRGMDWDAFNRSIDIAVSRLRAKLGDDSKEPRFIKTIWRKGYMFVAKTE